MDDKTSIITGWIRENCAGDAPDTQIDVNTPLLESGLLDSIQIVNLVDFLESKFGVKVEDEDLVAENFESVQSVLGLIEQGQGAS
ncbi:MAG: acyl carrier protein [Acidobacteriota bacterium]|nr:acyl carrier protein [Acidobacteriota bacterium]